MATDSSSYVIGIDVGTTSIKGMLAAGDGKIVSLARQEYYLETGSGNRCELEPAVYWDVTCGIIRELVAGSGVSPGRIAGISFSSQGETLVVVDGDGKPLRKAIVWLDNRAGQEALLVREHFGSRRILEATGQGEVIPALTANYILWLRRHEPETFRRAAKYLLVEDYLIFRFTGQYCTEASVSSSTLYLDISKRVWWTEMLDFIGIAGSQLPAIRPSGTVAGTLTPEATLAAGLDPATLCVVGSYDHTAGAIGSGNIRPGDVSLTIGASMAMVVALDEPVFDPSLRLPCQCHALEGMYMLQPYEPTAGMALKWFRDTFCQAEIENGERGAGEAYDLLVRLAEEVPPGAEGLLMLPHLSGSGSPDFDPDARGVFAGISLGMGKGHFVRAIIESVCMMVRRNLEVLNSKDVEVNAIRFLGGASKNSLWARTLANATGLPVVTLRNAENSVLGACILAAVGTGLFTDIETAAGAFVRTDRRFDPDPAVHSFYTGLYHKYLCLYRFLEQYRDISCRQ